MEVKTGTSTSEFLMTLLGVVLPFLNELLEKAVGWGLPAETLAWLIGLLGTYIVSRLGVKVAANMADAKVKVAAAAK